MLISFFQFIPEDVFSSGPLTPLEKLEQAYVEKEEEAILAAHIGQKLLQKVVEDERIIQELKTEVNNKKKQKQRKEQEEDKEKGK